MASPVTGVRANPKPTGSGLCRSATGRIESHKYIAQVRSPLLPQFGVELPTPVRSRPVNAASTVHMSPRQGFCYLAAHPFRKRFGSKGTCLRHKW
jgi:hypothetical protein